MKTCFIMNPKSGGGKGRQALIDKIEQYTKKAEGETHLRMTEHPEHASELSQRAVDSGYERVICVGGDGTVNEVARALVGSDVALGLVPRGSGNGLARHIGYPFGVEDALACIDSGRISQIDTGEANGSPFFNVMGVGFDAYMSRKFNALEQRGMFAYFCASLPALLNYQAEDFRIHLDSGQSMTQRAWMVSVANSSQYGSNACIAPAASLEDGVFDLVGVNLTGPFSACDVLFRLFNKSLEQSQSVFSHQAAEFTIEPERSRYFHIDGEVIECSGAIHIKVKKKSLKIIVPQNYQAN